MIFFELKNLISFFECCEQVRSCHFYVFERNRIKENPTRVFSLWDLDLDKKNPKYENRIDLGRSGPSSFDCAVNSGIQFLETLMKYLDSQFYKL